jgi:hypothetical protein
LGEGESCCPHRRTPDFALKRLGRRHADDPSKNKSGAEPMISTLPGPAAIGLRDSNGVKTSECSTCSWGGNERRANLRIYGRLQMTAGQVQVDAGGLQVCVSQQNLDGRQIGANTIHWYKNVEAPFYYVGVSVP